MAVLGADTVRAPAYRLSSLLGRKLIASDGEIGEVNDFYFDDNAWRLAYLVVHTSSEFDGRRLLMDPQWIVLPSTASDASATGAIRVDATCAEILASPDYTEDPPVSEQKAHDERLHPRFLWFPRLDGGKLALRPMGAPAEDLAVDEEEAREKGHNPHLRSFVEVRGYAVLAAGVVEEVVGHVLDLAVSECGPEVTQILINTGLGQSGDILTVEPEDVGRIDWHDLRVHLHRSHAELTLPKEHGRRGDC